jgi:hypothetical protein
MGWHYMPFHSRPHIMYDDKDIVLIESSLGSGEFSSNVCSNSVAEYKKKCA